MVKTEARRHRRLVLTVVFSSVLLGLIALALGDSNPNIVITALVCVAVLAAALHLLLPGSDFFTAVFGNSIGIYACVYVFFVFENFGKASELAQNIGFALPLVGFLIGVAWRRKEIVAAVGEADKEIPVDMWRAAAWITPFVLVAIGSFIVPIQNLGHEEHNIALLLSMAIIALTALLAARDIAAFLIDTAVLFGDFFRNAARLSKPAFAFFTCYSLIAILFGSLFAILDRFSSDANFVVGGELRDIGFGEALYLSVVTLSTVGYGDLSAYSPLARMLVAAEIFAGVMLLLFGVQAILSSSARR